MTVEDPVHEKNRAPRLSPEAIRRTASTAKDKTEREPAAQAGKALAVWLYNVGACSLLAVVTHLADNPNGGRIGSESLLRALRWADYLESHARRAAAICSRIERGNGLRKNVRRHAGIQSATARG